jgi:hypothetical protein
MADPKSNLQSLAHELDDAQRDILIAKTLSDDRARRFCRASDEYRGAMRDASFRILRRVERAPFRRRIADKAWSELISARDHVCILQRVGPELRLESEWLRALAMEERFEMIAAEYDLKRDALIDAKKSGTLKQHNITDGHIRTGEFELIDGVRVPVVEEIDDLL